MTTKTNKNIKDFAFISFERDKSRKHNNHRWILYKEGVIELYKFLTSAKPTDHSYVHWVKTWRVNYNSLTKHIRLAKKNDRYDINPAYLSKIARDMMNVRETFKHLNKLDYDIRKGDYK